MIEIQNISVKFEGKQVFENFSVDIADGQHVCFSGTSGRGKSTILKLIQAYVVPDIGKVIINGLELIPTNLSKVRASIAYIPQNVNLPVDNCNELVKMLDMSKKMDKVNELLNALDLDNEYYFRKFDQMSGGEKQRVVIAVCFALERKIILMDEPTASLDTDSAKKVLQLMKNMSDKTYVSASHNTFWIENADKIVEL